MATSVFSVTTIFLAVLAAACGLRSTTARLGTRRALAVTFALALTALPFLLPRAALASRVVLAGFAIALGTKIWIAFVGGGPRDGATGLSIGRYLLWLLVPPELRWPVDRADAASCRRAGACRLGRAAGKTLGLLAVACVKPHLPFHELRGVLLPLELYAFLTGLADLVTGAVMLGGVDVDETFRRPFLSASPDEFWGRRWNLYVGGFLRRHLFAPFARRGRPRLGVVASFAASGLMHEYLVLALLGLDLYRPGWMLAFFALQGLAMVLLRPTALRHALPRTVAIPLNTVWLLATSPLFFVPLAPAVDTFEGGLRAVVAALLP